MRYRIFLLLILLLAGCSHESPQSSSDPPLKTVSVQVHAVRAEEAVETQEFAGTLVAVNSANLATRLSGWITYLRVEEGDYVQQGEVVVRIDSRDITAQAAQAGAGVRQSQAQVNQALASADAAQSAIAEARANLETTNAMLPEANAQFELAQAEFKRMNLLHKEGALSDQDYDRSRTQVAVAKSQIEQIKSRISQAKAAVARAESGAQVARAAVGNARAGTSQAEAAETAALTPLEYASIVAPFSGYVVKKLAHVGEMTGPGQVLLKIEDTQRLRLEVPVPESRLQSFEKGRELRIEVDAVEGEFSGRVDQIVPAGDSASRTFLVKLSVNNPERRLLPGMYGRVFVEKEAGKSVRVPAEAVVKRGELEGFFLVGADKKAEYRLVKLGPEEQGFYEVLTGLDGDAEVILNPPAELRSGSPLEIKP